MKFKSRVLSVILSVTVIVCSFPIMTKAEDSYQLEEPTIVITSDKSSYGVFDTAIVTVKVIPTDGYPLENVNVEITLNKQLSGIGKCEYSLETPLLSEEGAEFSFNVVVSRKASGLTFFQKILMFFKRLFVKTFFVTGNTYDDDRSIASHESQLDFGSVKGLLTVNVWYEGIIENVDSDNDGLIDYIERINGMNPYLADSDVDSLSDYDELVVIGTNPVDKDTDGNGISDFEDDLDSDGLTNGYEISIGTSVNASDTDCDGLDDKEELQIYKTDPSKEDTDSDGATDSWEVNNGFNPIKFNSSFNVQVECQEDDLTASVNLSADGETAQSVTIEPVENNVLIDSTIPGYIGSAFEFKANGDTGITEISFKFNKELLNSLDFNPIIYCLNEETQTFYEYETKVNGNTATAQSTHFSTYILLNKNVYERYLKESNDVDFSSDSGVDSNNDGISDYLTKLMCDGVVRTGTGVKIFGNYSYKQIQSNSDIDGDGIKNGDEITADYVANIPDDAEEFCGHYYKRFDVGYVYDDAETYCESIGGYLVTITSGEEQKFVEQLLKEGNKNSYWIGARKSDGKFKWLTGEEFDYTNWAFLQPDDYSSSGYEDCIMMYNAYNPLNRNEIGEWNDLNNHAVCGNEPFFGISNFGFICEWGAYLVNGHSYSFVNSSPIYFDTDRDGFSDIVDPTPNKADVFASMTDYKKYNYDDEITITFFARQPIWNSRCCYCFSSPDLSLGYCVYGGSGHGFLGIDYIDESQKYFGFGGDTREFGESSGYPLTAITRKKVPGVWYNEKIEFTIGKTYVITEEDVNKVNEFLDKHKNDKYHISKNNCTTMAVKILKECGLHPSIFEHKWTADNILWIASSTYYGYSPADACQDIKFNYKTYIALKYYKLKNGSTVKGIEAVVKYDIENEC